MLNKTRLKLQKLKSLIQKILKGAFEKLKDERTNIILASIFGVLFFKPTFPPLTECQKMTILRSFIFYEYEVETDLACLNEKYSLERDLLKERYRIEADLKEMERNQEILMLTLEHNLSGGDAYLQAASHLVLASKDKTYRDILSKVVNELKDADKESESQTE